MQFVFIWLIAVLRIILDLLPTFERFLIVHHFVEFFRQ